MNSTQLTTTEAKTFGDWAYIAIHKHFEKALKHEDPVNRDEDPEELHQMRVGVRRLRSAIAAFAKAIELPLPTQDKNLGKIGRTLGVLRDIDVLQETLSQQYLPILPEIEQEILNLALEFLEKRRHKALKRVRKLFREDLYQDFKKSLHTWLAKPTYHKIAEIEIHLILSDLLLPEISRLLLHPGWLVGVRFDAQQINFPENREQILYLEAEILHDLRKEAKRTRYLLELFTQFYGDQYEYYLQQIKTIQTILGEIQDGFVLGEFLTVSLTSDWKKQMPTLVQQINNTRSQGYLLWGELQQTFLNRDVRKHLHLTLEEYSF